MYWDAIIKFIELLYYIAAGPVLVTAAIIGLKQISVTRESSRTSFKRDAYKIAAEQCNCYANKILPLYADLKKCIETNDIKFFKKFDVHVDAEGFGIKLNEQVSQKDLDKINVSNFFDLFNFLEGFSMYFVSGVATKEIGYMTTGKSFCNIVKEFLPLLFYEIRKGYYPNIATLFMLWNNRNESEKLKKEKDEIEKQLGEIQKININSVKTIGL